MKFFKKMKIKNNLYIHTYCRKKNNQITTNKNTIVTLHCNQIQENKSKKKGVKNR